ncbi:hypothetical protein SAMN06295937_1002219 [Sphingopyxis flava]|uniref:Transposase n=1 Tax=Sphingopyxis flava TaxID=1507287 RepID=A0A1T5A5H1_9SPHN|nr:hypothetical protein SAMN06295937_1002219 [Sphingopyxis flava]
MHRLKWALRARVKWISPFFSRRAFGFRNFHNYRLRVLALCGWNGVINRV